MGFSRQEYWSGLPHLPPADFPNPGTDPASLLSPKLAESFFTTGTAWEAWDIEQGQIKIMMIYDDLVCVYLIPVGWE